MTIKESSYSTEKQMKNKKKKKNPQGDAKDETLMTIKFGNFLIKINQRDALTKLIGLNKKIGHC